MSQKKGQVSVIKASGDRELFDEEKVGRSMMRAGIQPELQDRLMAKIKASLFDGITTRQIYDQILEALEQDYPEGRARYSLKQSILSLGPSGYPFEKFLGAMLEEEGYKVEYNQLLQGKCTEHEADLLAKKDGKTMVVECKFHNQQGRKTDVKDALYVKERFDDLVAGWEINVPNSEKVDEVWLATNTKFTNRALDYGMCSGMVLLAWNYPPGNSLRERIERLGVHPITCLFSISKSQKDRLMEEGIVLVRDIPPAQDGKLKKAGLSSQEISKLRKEADLVLPSKN